MRIYRFLTGRDETSFCLKVTKALVEGWELYGEPKYSFDPEARFMRCGQAVIKEVENQPFDPNKKLVDYD